ncbi:hypothetical protein CEE36_05775 [candidate division TA06 bacterium B3_TA06]|uniref:FlgD/Vpr Ig-like domain-containing protein n=1 Tax=candidate division TA06 bacterium B3_TA06 TaxID=2012487 RepID=A0A532V714_UNCT6|nr:MAG: hypothetical protein CEE36_05775 [candidate division TA06 bacterium B3_TA06]
MKRLTSLLAMVLLLVAAAGATAQVAEEWASYYDAYGYADYGIDVAVDTNGNIYVTGYSKTSSSSGYQNEDIVTIKYNRNGVRLWTATYDGPANLGDRASALAVDATGNVYVTGRSHSGQSEYDWNYVTIKYNTDGVQQWVATYDGPYNVDFSNDIVLDDQGNLYVTGQSSNGRSTGYDYATIKYDSNGVEQWVARYDGPLHEDDVGKLVEVDEMGNVYVTGRSEYSSYFPDIDYVTLKYNSNGELQWAKNYDYYERDEPYDLKVDTSGNVYVTGCSRGPSSGYDFATVKYDSLGNQKWIERYNGPANDYDYASGLAVDKAGNVYVTGYGKGTQSSWDMITIKYDLSGTELWVNRYNGPQNSHDAAYDIALDKDDDVYVTGHSIYSSSDQYDCMTIKYDSEGTEQWQMAHDRPTNCQDHAYALAVDKRKNVFITGNSTASGNDYSSYDFVTIRYSQILTDIDIVSIDSPADTVLSARTYTPQATVTNHEGDPVDFPVICEFDSSGVLVYCDTVEVVGLGGGDTTQVSFTDWTSGYADGITYTMTVFAAAEDDGEPDNDAISKTVTAVWPPRDVAPVAIITPPDFVWARCPHIPRAIVANLWEDPETFDARCEFDSAGTIIYSDVVTVTDLGGGDTVLVSFANWSAGAVDEFDYLMTVTTLHPKDLTPENDTISKIVAARKAVPDLDIQDYVGNLSANTMELTGVANSIVVGSYVMVNPDEREINFDVYDGPGNVDLDLSYSCTDLSTYGGAWMIPAANINPDLAGVNWLGLGAGAQNIVQAYIPNNAHFETHVGKVTAIGAAEDGSTDADEFTLKVNVVPPKGGGKPSSFGGEPLASGNRLYWPNFGFGEQGFNLYRAESEEFTKLNADLMNFTEYTDYDVAAGADYQYKLGLAMADESEVLLGPLSLTSSEEIGSLVLEQNWPNPWADATEICYFLPKGVSSATLKVYDVSGKLVKTLASGPQDAGAHSVFWDGRDEQGQSVASGVYFYMLKTGDQKQTKKMLLLR